LPDLSSWFHECGTGSGFDVSAVVKLQESAGSHALLLGQFVINLVESKDVWLVVGPLLAAWLTRRNGRKLRLKWSPDGGFEAEAQTSAELDTLIARVEKLQQRNQPKVIH